MNVAEYIIKRAEELGINEFFGIPGDYNFNIIRAIENNSATKWIGCTSELNAGYAADGYARVKGYGALITTYGVGELSAANAIAGSMAENIPIIHIVGLPSSKITETKKLIHHNFQEVNYNNFINIYKQITAATAILNRDNAKLEIDRIIKALIKEKKPVYIAIPDDIAQMGITDRAVSYDWTSDRNKLDELSAKIAEKINKSERPVIIGDTLVKRFDAKIEYKEFIEKTNIPTSNLIMGTNLTDMNSANYIGGYFGKYRNPLAQKYIENSDCPIGIGIIYSDLNSLGHSLPYNINDYIAIYGNYTYFEGTKYDNIKMSELLEVLTKLTNRKFIETEKPNIGLKPKEQNSGQLTSSYIYPRIQEFLKDNDIVFAETGTIPYGIAQIKFPASADIQFQLLWGSIGWATPAAFGAMMAKKNTRVILITGDGAHQITAMETGTMLEHGLKPVIIVINNNGYTTERLLSDTNDKFNNINQMNYAKFARIFNGDVWATQVKTQEDFDKALKVTQIMNKMCYIEACVDTFDVPELAKELSDDLKNQLVNTEIPDTMVNYNTNEFIHNSNNINFEYETVVHKGIGETDIKTEDK